MKLPRLLLLPLTLGLISAAASAACRPDASNTHIAVSGKKFYCTEGFDSEGCNIGRVRLNVEVDSTCRQNAAVMLECNADLDISTRSVDHLEYSLSERHEVVLKKGKADTTLYLDWRDFGYPAMDIDVTTAECHIAGAPAAAEPAEAEAETVEPEPAPQPEAPASQPVKPAPKPAAAPAPRPAVAPAPKPQQKELQPEMTQEQYELEKLREENRARELDIKALELKIKLKEMEQQEAK